MRILLTGATGFVGGALLDALTRAGHEVTALAHRGGPLTPHPRVRWLVRSLSDLTADLAWVEHQDAVAHCAASPLPAFEAVNRAFVRAVLQRLQLSQAFLMHAGSLVFGDAAETPISESTPYRPPPGLEARAQLEADVRRHGAGPLKPRTFVCYAALAYGGDGAAIPRLLADVAAHRGRAVRVDRAAHWSAIHVADWAQLMRRCLEQGPAGGRAYFAAAENLAIDALVAQIAAELDLPIETLEPAAATRELGFFATALTVQQRLDPSAAQRELGWHPVQAGVADWLRHWLSTRRLQRRPSD